MNREIKFRAFENKNGRNRMFNWNEVKKDFELWLNCKDTFIMQFTGIKDVNGKEIYEGDICKCRYYKHAEKDLYLIQEIVFEQGSFNVIKHDLEPDLEIESYAHCPLNWVDQIEVIGNIYENPELLK